MQLSFINGNEINMADYIGRFETWLPNTIF